jgi:hypothetical protein
MHINWKDFSGREFAREIRLINKLILHCSDSDNPLHDDISVIKQWHLERGFIDVGYHFFIKKDGTIQIGRPIYMIGAHCAGQNLSSLGICFSGKTAFTAKQFKAAKQLCISLRDNYKIKEIDVYLHNHFNKNKTCPNFNLDKIR